MNIYLNFSWLSTVQGEYLVDTPTCKIPNMNPFVEEAMKIFSKSSSINCSRKHPLTSIVQNYETDNAFLMIHDEFKSEFLYWWHEDVEVTQ